MSSKPKNKGGRPPIYDAKRSPSIAAALARNGETQERIAAIMGISRSTLWKWAKDHEDFSSALSETRDSADAEIEYSMFKRARGYEYEESKTVGNVNADGTLGHRKLEKTVKQIPPDVMAGIFWLRNRQPAKYKDKPDDPKPPSLVRVRRMIMPAKPTAEVVAGPENPVTPSYELHTPQSPLAENGVSSEIISLGSQQNPNNQLQPVTETGDLVTEPTGEGGGEGAVCPA